MIRINLEELEKCGKNKYVFAYIGAAERVTSSSTEILILSPAGRARPFLELRPPPAVAAASRANANVLERGVIVPTCGLTLS